MVKQQGQRQQLDSGSYRVKPQAPRCVRPQRPQQRESEKRNGAAHIGRLSDTRKSRASRNGTIATTSAAANIPMNVVDQGKENASRTANTSVVVNQAAGSRHRFRNNSATDCFDSALTPCLGALY